MSEEAVAEDPTLDDIIQEIEVHSGQSMIGPQTGYFELPVGGAREFIRGVYRTYVVQAPTFMEALSGMRAVIKEQIDIARTQQNVTALVWRYNEKISVEQGDDGAWRARTRITVLPEESMK